MGWGHRRKEELEGSFELERSSRGGSLEGEEKEGREKRNHGAAEIEQVKVGESEMIGDNMRCGKHKRKQEQIRNL